MICHFLQHYHLVSVSPFYGNKFAIFIIHLNKFAISFLPVFFNIGSSLEL